MGRVKVSVRREIVKWNLTRSKIHIGPIRDRGELGEDVVVRRGGIPSSLHN